MHRSGRFEDEREREGGENEPFAVRQNERLKAAGGAASRGGRSDGRGRGDGGGAEKDTRSDWGRG